MATTKKVATKATTKATEVKEVKEVKVEAPVAPVVEVKEEVKAEVKAEAKKAPAKKAATTTKKAPAKKAAAKTETVITVQFQGLEASIATVEERVKAQFVAEGNKASSIKSLNIYVKPEEHSAYYVINGEATGRVNLF